MSRTTLLTQLRERVLARIQRGPLLDISIGRSARRFDLLELANDDPRAPIKRSTTWCRVARQN